MENLDGKTVEMALPSTKIMDLPPEILVFILKNVSSVEDMISCLKTCTTWKNLIMRMFRDKGKFLVVSWHGYEIVDLLNPSTNYSLLAKNFPKVSGATGGLLQKSPIICGGWHRYDGWCLDLLSKNCGVIGKPEMEMKMIEKRNAAASVVLNQTNIWIIGGMNRFSPLSSTEFIKIGQPSIKGPDLPFTICNHSMIQYDEKSIYIIGGDQNNSSFGYGSSNTWIANPTNGFQITRGPCLNEKRKGHGCAKMTINGRTILVVAGGYKPMDSVEILDPSTNNKWIPGPKLPLKLRRLAAMVTSPTGKGVIVMGGLMENHGTRSNAMFELSDSMEWTTLKQTLKKGHGFTFSNLAIPLPDELVREKENKNQIE